MIRESKDFKLLQAYLDHELSLELRDQLEVRLAQEGKLTQELDQLLLLRSGLRSVLKEDLEKEKSKWGEVDLWDKISKQIKHQELFEKKFNLLEYFYFFKIFNSKPVSIAFVGALAVAVFVFISPRQSAPTPQQFSSIKEIADSSDIKGIELPFMGSSNELNWQVGRNAFRSVNPNGQINFVSQGETKLGNGFLGSFFEKNRIDRDSMELGGSEVDDEYQRRFPSGVLVDQQLLRNGFQANGVDFDWIKSDRQFHVFSVEERETPPVIWIAQRKVIPETFAQTAIAKAGR